MGRLALQYKRQMRASLNLGYSKIITSMNPKLGSKPQYRFEHSEIYSAIFFIPL